MANLLRELSDSLPVLLGIVSFVAVGAIAELFRRSGRFRSPATSPDGSHRRREFGFGWMDADQREPVRSALEPQGRYKLWIEFDDPSPGATRFSADGAVLLDVVVFVAAGDPRFVGERYGQLTLGPDGYVLRAQGPSKVEPLPSERRRLWFELYAPSDPGRLTLRVGIYFAGRLLRSYRLDADVAKEGGQPPGVRADYSVTDVFDGRTLEAASTTRLSILLNHNADDEHGIYVMAGVGSGDPFPASGRIAGPVLDRTLTNVRHTLAAAIGTETYRYDDEAVLADDLIELAKVGADLWFTLTANVRQWMYSPYEARITFQKQVRRPAAIEVASVFDARLGVPAGFVYDFPLDRTTRLRVCAAGMAALTSDDPSAAACFQGDCPSWEDEAVVCPAGFWGFRHEICTPLTHALPDDPNAMVEPGLVIPDDDGRHVTVGASRDPELTRRKGHVDWLRSRCGPKRWTYVDRAADARRALRDGSPHLIYFYCHGGVLTTGNPYLQFGPEGTEYDYLQPDSVTGPAWSTTPLVVLNGCKTTAQQADQQMSFLHVFLRERAAAAVVGSEVVVFDGIACDYLEAMLASLVGGHQLGAATRQARLQLLGKGSPAGLAYNSFGSHSVRFAAARRTAVPPRAAGYSPMKT